MGKMILASLLVGTIFVLVKLTGAVAWAWWVVLSPFYGFWAILLGSLLLWGIASLLVSFSCYMIDIDFDAVVLKVLKERKEKVAP